jgi:hypothetical protein
MAAIHLIFEVQQIGDDWQLRVHGWGKEIEYIKGFPSKAAAEKWPASREAKHGAKCGSAVRFGAWPDWLGKILPRLVDKQISNSQHSGNPE